VFECSSRYKVYFIDILMYNLNHYNFHRDIMDRAIIISLIRNTTQYNT